MSDPFETAAIRDRVLAGWSAAPVRLREDANAEEDLALGGYRDRLVVELAQNAADAAARAGIAGRLALTLHTEPGTAPVLVAANTGESLTAAGVQSLATLRASVKVDDDASVGRFGVGFAAVLAVTDEPTVLSDTGGVRFSRADTAALVAEVGAQAPALSEEVRRRDGHVPVLRLPFAAEGTPPEGYDTAVLLPLRDQVAVDAVRAQLAAVDDLLLLALPALAQITIDDPTTGSSRRIEGAASRWHVVRRAGSWTDAQRKELLAGRPTEERRQRGWELLWALPLRAADALSGQVHAPTPTDEPLSLPALLLASLPLDPTRRHIAPGPLTDWLVAECARAYGALLHERAVQAELVWDLVPTGLPAGAFDASLREWILTVLAGTPLLPAVEDGHLVRPRDAVALDLDVPSPALEVLAPRLAGLVAGPRTGRAAGLATLRALGGSTISLSEVVEQLPAQGDPASWYELYQGLAGLADDPAAREALATIAVPLVDGRVVRGARGLLLPDPDEVAAATLEPLAPYGLRVVHPLAAHPLLARLEALPATARSVLDDPAVQVAVRSAGEDDADQSEVRAVAASVLALVEAALAQGGLRAEHMVWLRDLTLPDDAGEPTPASALVLPGSLASQVLDPDQVGLLDADVVTAWPRPVLLAVGVLDGLRCTESSDVDLTDFVEVPDDLADLEDFGQWAAQAVRSGARVAGQVRAVHDLDLVLADQWPQVLQHLSTEPRLRSALVDPVRASPRPVPGYTAWWLRRELGLAGQVIADGDDLDGLLQRAPGWTADLDDQVREALGLVDLSERGADHAPSAQLTRRLVAGLADPTLTLSGARCLQVWRWLSSAAALLDDEEAAPQRVRVLDGVGSQVVERSAAVVVDDPQWLQRPDLGGFVIAPGGDGEALADLLDLDLASERSGATVTSVGVTCAVPDDVRSLLGGGPSCWYEHDELIVDGHEVDWWVEPDGAVHASTTQGLARGLAWSAGRWQARAVVEQALAEPDQLLDVLVDAGWDERSPQLRAAICRNPGDIG